MNELDDQFIDKVSFAFREIRGQDRWDTFVVTASLVLVGAPTYLGRHRFVGKVCEFQISAIAATSIASTAGTHYFDLPTTTAKGIGGVATMTDNTTNIAVGVCHIDVATSRCYTPTLVASGDLFTICGWYEV